MSFLEELKHLQIPLQDILLATNEFADANLIAVGGFGKVYLGKSDKHGIIAVKRLDRRQGQGDREFLTEIDMLSFYKHENIVSLHGFCDEDSEKILVYQHEKNGSLDRHINSTDLNWTQRLQICLDAARGLKYLHDDVGSLHRIIHRDIKTSNILLDENMKAKISDFGLSKTGPANVERTFLISNACGTIGYVDPEYIETAVLTKESDVYSFGVVLFEVLCGRLARVKDERLLLSHLAQKHFERDTLDEIIPSYLQINAASLTKFTNIAYQCLRKRKERPTMTKVVERLQKAMDDQLAPSGPLTDVYDGFSVEDTTDYIVDDDFAALHQGQTGSHSIPASSSSQSWKYDVYISFRGEDTRKTFVDHLYVALVQQGIETFKDDEKIAKGIPIDSVLLKAIEESRISIIIFSKNYASSSWCLDELTCIMKCMEETEQIVFPVFYDVEPSEVRKQRGEFGEAFARHSQNMRAELWRGALSKASSLAGWDRNTANGHEAKLIKNIVDAVSFKLVSLMSTSAEDKALASVDTDLIGIETRVQELESLLEVGSGSVHMIGICGIWGTGKSTLASSIYKQIRFRFDGSCFVKNVCAESRMNGLKTLQEIILSNVYKSKVTLRSTEEGMRIMQRRLCHDSVLIVLDDVDHIDHLKMLAGSRKWFGNGSRIIITTRNKDLVIAHNVNITHNVRLLDDEEAIKVFSRRAFGAGRPVKGYEEISLNIVTKFGGHPSSLSSLGSFLHGKHMAEWKCVLARLEGIPVDELLEKFKHGDDGVKRNIHSWFFT